MQRSLSKNVFLLSGFIILVLIFINRENLREDATLFIESAKINIYNLQFLQNPTRRQPINTLSKEMQLQEKLGEPFISFTQSDWKEFWNIIYGAYPLEASENERLPKKYRNLTSSEIVEKLQTRFVAFQYYEPQLWSIMLNEVLNVKG